MDLTSKKTIRDMLQKYAVRPQKKFGQHFLVSRHVLAKILQAARLKQGGVVLEVGPGIGTLTQELAKSARRVIAVEKDIKMTDVLRETVSEYKNIELIYGDILKLDAGRYTLDPKYKVVANLPYYMAAPAIRMFLEAKRPPQEMILMVQKKVGQRICAKPPQMNILAISVQFYAEPKIVSYVPKGAFWPRPKVDSAIIKITRTHTDKKTDSHIFFKIVRAGFSHPRKQLLNNFTGTLKMQREEIKKWLGSCDIDPSRRAQTLELNDWAFLAKNFPR